MARFWNKLEHNWFELFPEELALGLPMPGPGVVYTPEQLQQIGEATQLRKLRLKRVIRYQARRVTQKRTAGHAAASLAIIEVYQKVKKDEIKVLLDKAGYGQINEEVESAAAAAADAAASGRILDAVSAEEGSWDNETEEVKLEFQEMTREANEERASQADDRSELEDLTPEELQDISYGTTSNGATLEASHPNWDGQVAAPIAKFFKRAFPHDVRDARALHKPAELRADLDGLIPMPSDDANEDLEQASVQPVKAKRIRRPIPKKVPTVPMPAVASLAMPSLPTASVTPQSSPLADPTGTQDSHVAPPLDSEKDALGVDGSGAAGSCSFDRWDGMLLPMSPTTTETIASRERGQPVSMENIDPALYGGQTPTAQPSRVGPRPIYQGAVFSRDREVGGSPGRQPRATVEIGGFHFPISSPYRPSTLDIIEQQVFSSSPTPAPRQPLALAAFNSAMGARSMASPPHGVNTPVAVVPSISRPSAPPPVLITLVGGVPATHPTTTAPIDATAPSPPTVPVGSATVPAVVPAPQFIQSRPMANHPKGHPSTAVAKALTLPKVTKGGRAHAPKMTEAARIVTAHIRKEEAAQRKERARVLAIVVEQEKAVKRLQPNLHNPDGNSDLYVTRPKRNAAVLLNPDGTPFELPKKLTRAEMAARKMRPRRTHSWSGGRSGRQRRQRVTLLKSVAVRRCAPAAAQPAF
ncbi:hypothetical protein B0H10DRAFT_2442013 [Mycena sp. CBHHK59/15]|nr:hypothetical protein B0H10DRAFT_2442013 [Mycena sp. CBHHK59/15]